MSDRNHAFWRYLYYTTASSIWLASVCIVWLTTSQTQLGYEMHRVRQSQEVLIERNLRLKCELATLYDLDKAKIFALDHGFELRNPSKIITLDELVSQ